MKVLIVGKGGREHALAWKCRQSSLVTEVFAAPGNPGMAESATLVDIQDSDINKLADFAAEKGIDLTIVGPESSLALGIADVFQERGLKVFGPKEAAAKIESSKDFAKEIMLKYNIPTAGYRTFSEEESAKAYVAEKGAPIVIKEDGLKAGKGVTVAMTMDEAYEALEIAFAITGNKVVIEDYLEGFEFSLIALVHGETVIPLEVGQDHKRVFDGDLGPNTGGMGVYSPVRKITPAVIDKTVEEIMKPMAKALVSEGIPFTGFLFGGIMLGDDGEVKTIEFNARFGDPEAEVILPRMESDLVKAILDVMEGKESEIAWSNTVTVGVVLASEGYPASSTKGAPIEIASDMEALVFHMGTKLEGETLVTDGGRVLIVVAEGETLEAAKIKAYENVGKIKCEKLFFRRDIGAKDML